MGSGVARERRFVVPGHYSSEMEPVSESPVVAPSPDELASILRNVGDGITAQGADGRLVFANDAAARLCGLDSGEEMLRLSVPELLERFEIIGEDRRPMAIDELPNRRALLTALGAGRSARLPAAPVEATSAGRSCDRRRS